MSQKDLAAQLDLTPAAVGQWEMGLAGISKETLGKLPSVLHVSLNWLMWGGETNAHMVRATKPEGMRNSDGVALDAELLNQAYQLGIDVPAALEAQLRSLVGQAKRERWLDENRAAIADANAFLARHELWSDGKRQF